MISDSFHEQMTDAMEEAARRRSDPLLRDVMTKIEPSAYGGYRVRSIPADFYVDQIAEGMFMGAPSGSMMRHVVDA